MTETLSALLLQDNLVLEVSSKIFVRQDYGVEDHQLRMHVHTFSCLETSKGENIYGMRILKVEEYDTVSLTQHKGNLFP